MTVEENKEGKEEENKESKEVKDAKEEEEDRCVKCKASEDYECDDRLSSLEKAKNMPCVFFHFDHDCLDGCGEIATHRITHKRTCEVFCTKHYNEQFCLQATTMGTPCKNRSGCKIHQQ